MSPLVGHKATNYKNAPQTPVGSWVPSDIIICVLSHLLVSVSGSKYVKADISVRYSNDDSSCKSGESALTAKASHTWKNI